MGVRAVKRRCSVCHASYSRGEAFCPLDGGAIVAEAQEDDLVGQTIDGRYLISEVLGTGGMGKVYAAEHVGLGKRVALKFVSDADANRDQRARFRQEARAASQIVHENVVQIFDVGVDAQGRDFIVMEYVAGQDLDELLRTHGALPPARAIAIAQQILRGLHVVHEAGIVHRDIKPANIRLTGDTVKIMDFGIAKSLRSEVAQTDTGTGRVIGTPQFMAPEQIVDGVVDRRADIYAVGATLYAMLAGQPPFASTSFTQRMATPTAPSLASLRGDLAPSLVAAITRALSPDAAGRFPDALSFAAALGEGAIALAARMDAATKPMAYPGMPHVETQPRARSLVPVIVTLAVLLAAAGGTITFLLMRGPKVVATTPPPPPVTVDATVVAVVEAPSQPVVPADAAVPDAKPASKQRVSSPPAPKAAPKDGVATTFIPPPAGMPSGKPSCFCQFQNEKGSIEYACAQKRADYRCVCRGSGSTTLCPFVLTVIDEHKRKADGARGGTMYCVDRTRTECDPLDKAMPTTCSMMTITRVKGEPVQDAACEGYVSGLTADDPKIQGHWSCSTCDGSLTAPRYTGKTGDTCSGFDGKSGKPITGFLRC